MIVLNGASAAAAVAVIASTNNSHHGNLGIEYFIAIWAVLTILGIILYFWGKHKENDLESVGALMFVFANGMASFVLIVHYTAQLIKYFIS